MCAASLLPHMATQTRRVVLGVLLLLTSTVIIMATGTLGAGVPAALGAIAALGLAAGSVLVGLSEEDAAV